RALSGAIPVAPGGGAVGAGWARTKSLTGWAAGRGGAVYAFTRRKSGLAFRNQPWRRGACDGERLTDGATNRTVQVHATECKFRATCLALEVGGAVLRGVWRAPHAAFAKCRRSGALRSRNRIRNPRIH